MATLTSSTLANSDPPSNGAFAPDPEVLERPRRRRFSAEYRLRIVRKPDARTKPGELKALIWGHLGFVWVGDPGA